jgi:hypothetical protein
VLGQAVDVPVDLSFTGGRAGTLFVRAWFEAEVPQVQADDPSVLGPGVLFVTVKRALNLRTPLLGSINPYVRVRVSPGPSWDATSLVSGFAFSTPVCTSKTAHALLVLHTRRHLAPWSCCLYGALTCLWMMLL